MNKKLLLVMLAVLGILMIVLSGCNNKGIGAGKAITQPCVDKGYNKLNSFSTTWSGLVTLTPADLSDNSCLKRLNDISPIIKIYVANGQLFSYSCEGLYNGIPIIKRTDKSSKAVLYQLGYRNTNQVAYIDLNGKNVCPTFSAGNPNYVGSKFTYVNGFTNINDTKKCVDEGISTKKFVRGYKVDSIYSCDLDLVAPVAPVEVVTKPTVSLNGGVVSNVEVKSTGNKVEVLVNSSPILEVSSTVDLSKVTLQKEGSKEVVTGLVGVEHYLFIDNTQNNGAFVCPKAQTLAEVKARCDSIISYTHEQCVAGTSGCVVVGTQYKVKVSGSGAGENPSGSSCIPGPTGKIECQKVEGYGYIGFYAVKEFQKADCTKNLSTSYPDKMYCNAKGNYNYSCKEDVGCCFVESDSPNYCKGNLVFNLTKNSCTGEVEEHLSLNCSALIGVSGKPKTCGLSIYNYTTCIDSCTPGEKVVGCYYSGGSNYYDKIYYTNYVCDNKGNWDGQNAYGCPSGQTCNFFTGSQGNGMCKGVTTPVVNQTNVTTVVNQTNTTSTNQTNTTSLSCTPGPTGKIKCQQGTGYDSVTTYAVKEYQTASCVAYFGTSYNDKVWCGYKDPSSCKEDVGCCTKEYISTTCKGNLVVNVTNNSCTGNMEELTVDCSAQISYYTNKPKICGSKVNWGSACFESCTPGEKLISCNNGSSTTYNRVCNDDGLGYDFKSYETNCPSGQTCKLFTGKQNGICG